MRKIILQNTREEIDNEFYIFINPNNLITKLNLENTKSIFSAAFSQSGFDENFREKYLRNEIDYLPFVPNNNKDTNAISMFNHSITSNYRVEYNLEQYRKNYHPQLPSRLSACYAFKDFETCKKVAEKYEWNKTSKICKFHLIEDPLNKIIKANMEIVSLAITANQISMQDTRTLNDIGNSYWNAHESIELELPTVNGRQNFESGTIWEYLIEGRLLLVEN